MENTELIIKCDENTQYKIEKRPEGLWSGGPEICIAHILDNKRSRTNPSIPLEHVPELIEYLAKAYKEMIGQQKLPMS